METELMCVTKKDNFFLEISNPNTFLLQIETICCWDNNNRIQQILFKRVILREKILTSVEQSYWTQREM